MWGFTLYDLWEQETGTLIQISVCNERGPIPEHQPSPPCDETWLETLRLPAVRE